MLIWHGWSEGSTCTYPLIFVQPPYLGLEKLNTTVGPLLTICRDPRVLSRALAALRLLQLGSHVGVRVSEDLWSSAILFDCAHAGTDIENANCRRH